MSALQLAVLAMVQGLTEFLPISSSAHLAVASRLLGWPDQGLAVDIAMHVGSLGAVMVYFWRDVRDMLAGVARLLGGRVTAGGRLALLTLLGSVPLVIAGAFGRDLVDAARAQPLIIGLASVGFGVLLYAIDRWALTVNRLEHMRWSGAIVVGLAQVLAMIPGTSRSGVTITAGRLLGLERGDAARFAMLLSIPAILGAGALEGYDLYVAGAGALNRDALYAAVMAFGAALIAISAMMAWVRHASFTPFVIYRVAFGLFLIAWFWRAA